MKVKTVTLTEIRQSGVHNNTLAESAYLVLNSFWELGATASGDTETEQYGFALFLFCF